MTGYGLKEESAGPVEVSVSIRTVNHRFLTVKVGSQLDRGPLFQWMEKKAKGVLQRGHCEIRVSVRGKVEESEELLQLDGERADKLKSELERVAGALFPQQRVGLEHLLRFSSELIRKPSATLVSDESLRAVFLAALSDLQNSRLREGEALRKVLQSQIAALRRILNLVEALLPTERVEREARVRARLSEIFAKNNAPAPEDRVAQEVALLIERSDVTEEVDRLKVHFGLADDLLDGRPGVGKKLDFLAQELNREINTLGSKAQSAAITHHVLNMKSELERFREQVQNVE